MKKFKELFPNPVKINELSPSKTKFSKFLNQIQRDLHSKVAVVGPYDAGKTTLYNTLKSGQEKKIMHFENPNEICFKIVKESLRRDS